MLTKNESLQCAAIKLQRAMDNDGLDPVSGFSAPEIVRWLCDQGPDGERIASKHGALDLANVNW